MDARNRHDPSHTEPLKAGKTYGLRWDFQPNDYVFKAGHRLVVVVISTSYDYTLRYPAGAKVTVSARRQRRSPARRSSLTTRPP
ncbi:hypothetical protein OG417_24655 [Actinoallomurus sp. NBC_01490]|uniref:CocE/NonD family hydrolase C-terminal non-catalytic domain-containing protein n=1 Tax=Actinoallomurus sp. NBC_01490 TaxID=2903557 RepID=UPI002E33A8F8|nr:CocE/NonD family hydrolase C-terminal non-catalytic domain-containing protein [Actinoallomurus sp. NBC_01490]